MKRKTTLSNITIQKLIYGGKGLAQAPDGKKIIISGGATPGSVISVRILKNRKTHYEGQILSVEKKSPLEQKLPQHFQLYGGCKWLTIPYEKQLEIKQDQVFEAFHQMQKAPYIKDAIFHRITASPEIYGYRNKVEFSWGKYISDKEGVHDEYRFGFHEQGSFDRIVDCAFCVLGSDHVNSLFKEFDRWARSSDLPTYDQKIQKGFWRHLVIRESKSHDECMIILSINGDYFEKKDEFATFQKKYIDFLSTLSGVSSGYLLNNTGRADIVDGEYVHVFGNTTILETLMVGGHSRSFEIAPRSFFQTNTLGAQGLYEITRSCIKSPGGTVLDLYAGTGTLGIIVADMADEVYSVELVSSASQDNEKNLTRNSLSNISVINAKVEDFLKDFQIKKKQAQTIIIDPPRAGMHPDAPQLVGEFGASEIIYVSCNPSTLVRDLTLICEKHPYSITDIYPVDMFPHTHHIETVVRLQKSDSGAKS